MEHFVDRVLNVSRGVVGYAELHTGRQLLAYPGKSRANFSDDLKRVGIGKHPNAHEGRAFPVESHILIVVLSTEYDVGDVAQADNDSLILFDYQLAKFLGRAQISVRHQVHGNHGTFGISEGREIVIIHQRRAHVGRGDPASCHLVRLQPNPHGEGSIAEDVGPLHPADRAQLRLNHASQIVCDLVLIEVGGRKAEVHRRKLGISRLQIDDRNLRIGRQIIANLCHFRLDLSQRCSGVVIDLQVNCDRADTLSTCRLHVVDAIGAGNYPLDRGSDKSAHQVSACSDVHGRNLNDGYVAPRILPDAKRANCVQTRNQNHEVNYDRKNRPLYE
jgi:hypothetical protein